MSAIYPATIETHMAFVGQLFGHRSIAGKT